MGIAGGSVGSPGSQNQTGSDAATHRFACRQEVRHVGLDTATHHGELDLHWQRFHRAIVSRVCALQKPDVILANPISAPPLHFVQPTADASVRNKDIAAKRAPKSARGGYARLRLSSACGVANAAADPLGR